MGNELITFGYYICSVRECPEYLEGLADKFISISDCLCEHEPKVYKCEGWRQYRKDKAEYIGSRFGGDTEAYRKMSETANDLFNKDLLCMDGRILRREDALHFYREYFDHPWFMLVSVSTEEKYLAALHNFPYEKNMTDEGDELMGYDIIGWDNSGFHSFLCNSLHEDFPDARFTGYGLLDEGYEQVARMAQKIQGEGEPVDWMPVRIDLIT